MGVWSFTPSYDITLTRKNPKAGTRGQSATLSWQLRTLSEFQGLLATTNTSSQATITLNDPTGAVIDVVKSAGHGRRDGAPTQPQRRRGGRVGWICG